MTDDLKRSLKEEAHSVGFTLVGVASPEPTDHLPFYRTWLERGLHGGMAYLARDDAVERRADLSGTMADVRSVLVVAHEHYQEDDPDEVRNPSRGIIARYARGADYHRVVKKKLLALAAWLDDRFDEGVGARAYVDTGPILERDLARRAGLGWFGRNTMLIHPRRGSYFFLGALLLDVELEPDEPFRADHCGSCRACLDACPTGALLGRDAEGAPVIDARRCISYLTIEHRGSIPLELRPLMGNRVYGCDICQEVCPFNARFAERTTEPRYAARGPGELPVGVEALPGERAVEAGEASGGGRGSDAGGYDEDRRDGAAGLPGDVSAETHRDRGARGGARPTSGDVSAETSDVGSPLHPGTETPSLVELLAMALDEDRWEVFSRGSAIRRAGRAGFARNVCVAMGNWLGELDGLPEDALAVLEDALRDDDVLVREHAAWALEQSEPRHRLHRSGSPGQGR